jgi:succinoglycan biosynthesis protein ExoA
MTPRVSIIIPCFNEEKTILDLIEAIHRQTFNQDELEIIIADALSIDDTREKIGTYQKSHPDSKITLIENEKRTIPAGLNRALKIAKGEYVIRLDAHSVPADDYIERCVADLDAGKGDNVGGIWEIRPGGEGWIAKSIASAASHPLGAGDARYRFSSKAGLVDTVPFGAFRKSIFERVGEFDETLKTNEDYELNARIRQAGGKIWFDPQIHSVYFSRQNLKLLAQQYWRYGFWKWKMLRRYPSTLRWRQALPPIFVLSLVILLIFSIFFWQPGILLALELLFYLALLVTTSIQIALKKKDASYCLGFPLAISTMHFFWGAAFLWSMVKSTFGK